MASTALQSSLLASTASLSFSQSVDGKRVAEVSAAQPVRPRTLQVRAESKITGTKVLKKLKVLAVGDKTGTLRAKASPDEKQVKLLSRVQELRLLSKAEQAGLLTLAENLGLSLGTIEKLGLLSKAEQSGVLSAATDPKTPVALTAIALALLVAGPALVFVIPDDSTVAVVLQVVLATLTVVGGAAAFGGSQLVSSLQKL